MNPTTARNILDAARGKIVRERQTRREQIEWAGRQALEREAKRVVFVGKHGTLLWRSFAWYGRNRYVTGVLRTYQGWGYLTPAQLQGLRRTVSFLEHGLRGPQ